MLELSGSMPLPARASDFQTSLPGLCQLADAVELLAGAGVEARGAIYTRREVVDFMLDLIGYTDDQPLHEYQLLEPSVGHGDFLLPAVDRLLTAFRRAGGDPKHAVEQLSDCLLGVEIHRASFAEVTRLLDQSLQQHGLSAVQRRKLCDQWLYQGDFLQLPHTRRFTHIVGNPPYVRQEMIADVLMAEYRRRFQTIYDRADLYVPFIEQSLFLLQPTGRLGFICADRWIKNRYGGPLRKFVAQHFHLQHFVDMVDTPAFHSDVIAYPAIVVIGREPSGPTRVALRPAIDRESLATLAKAMTARKLGNDPRVAEVAHAAVGSEPWVLEASAQLAVVRRIEASFPLLEAAGCKVGIGVATGADQVFIGKYDELDVEPDRKLPLAMTRDILSGEVRWRGLGVINPFGPGGKLVSLAEYPRLAAYLEKHGAAIRARHVSKKNPQGWFRTIDRIYPKLAAIPKLLIPDIKGSAHIVYEDGQLYPHHNLYFVISDTWDLHALQAVLLSDVTKMFILLYSTKMRGGYLRFQAQYLRRLRLPEWSAVPKKLQQQLIAAGKARDPGACNATANALYQLTPAEQKALNLIPEAATHAA